MRFRAPEYYDSDEESGSEAEWGSTPAAPASRTTPSTLPNAVATSNAPGSAAGTRRARIRELRVLSKKKQAKHKRRGKAKIGIIGMKRVDAYLARRRGQHNQGPLDPGQGEERKDERAEGDSSRESAAPTPMVMDIGNPLACGLGYVFDDFIRNLAGPGGSGNGGANHCPSSGSYIAPGAFPGLDMVDSEND